MPRKRYSPDEIIHKLREAGVLLNQGQKVQEGVRQLAIVEQTHCRWRKEYGGLDKSQAARMKEVERENLRLMKLVANLSLDKAILEEAASKVSRPGQAAESGRRPPCRGRLCAGLHAHLWYAERPAGAASRDAR